MLLLLMKFSYPHVTHLAELSKFSFMDFLAELQLEHSSLAHFSLFQEFAFNFSVSDEIN